ncbi:MAG: HlyC/CorC family transporter, partial [Deltaproteobacteria bacterium]|nr:HlyC/CorC family transporter [Deltaproteobacteria bacterium]
LGIDHGAALATGVTTLVVLLFAEVVPKTFAKKFSTNTALTLMPAVALLYLLLYPITTPLAAFPRVFGKLLGTNPAEHIDPLTSHELQYLIEEGGRKGSLDEVKQELLTRALDFTETLVKEIMLPRTRVVAIDLSSTGDEVIKLAAESELSRIPVFRDSLDEITGVLYTKLMLADLKGGLPQPFVLAKYVRPAFFVPEVMKVSRLLQEMQKRKTHLAIVVDEFGGTSGIVTMEDVVEEIVGDIHDESDIEERGIKQLSDGVVLADGQVTMRELEASLEVDFPDDRDYESLGGFLTSTAGRVPPPGSLVMWGGLTFTVKAGDERRVLKVEIAKKKPHLERPESRPPQPKAAPESKPPEQKAVETKA